MTGSAHLDVFCAYPISFTPALAAWFFQDQGLDCEGKYTLDHEHRVLPIRCDPDQPVLKLYCIFHSS